jgi:hypothetical protein
MTDFETLVEPHRAALRAHVLTLRGPRIAVITSFVDPEVFPDLGLPERLA